MKVSISNIAWEKENDETMYKFLQKNGVEGLEIAPTRLFPDSPYDHINEAKETRKRLYEDYGLNISSMQSIWYGRNEKIFESEEQRNALLEYSKKAAEFANALGCNNMVFGCPRNRNIENERDIETAYVFFDKMGEIALEAGTIFALEANPPIYNTNFLNKTNEVCEFLQNICSAGIKINYDLGTVIENKEPVSDIKGMMEKINHIHVSEPYLAQIKYGEVHNKLVDYLFECSYSKYISIEMKNTNDIECVKNVVKQLLTYVRR